MGVRDAVMRTGIADNGKKENGGDATTWGEDCFGREV